ncbi:GAF domain-containing protein [Pseudonocardia sp. C8]|uniref:GAF domain-containing sensor histidine kinase n=1 Tax=Pseudonocardia sp. C8 TaxID=2762759 RepID=UPI0016432B06|nr:histidine kinase [Pseudonocardia sp. C8]MBC3194991.1 GAF domain-containing protein [Pseudonocardia sp. C8]
MPASERSAVERAREREHLLDSLLAERDGLETVLDRVLALDGTARMVREAAGLDAAFVADIDRPGRAVVRWQCGNRTDLLQDLVVPEGRGIGGRAIALGVPVRVDDYLTSSTITHHFDVPVLHEKLGAMLAVPVLDTGRDGTARPVAVAYGALRHAAVIGDDAVDAVERVAAQAARALRLAERAEAGRITAVLAERQRMQASLHDSVGAMLFSIGAQVRDLRAALPDNPELAGQFGRLEADVSAATTALREALLALSETTPERALPVELAEHCRSFSARTGVPARFVQLGPVEPLDPERTAVLVAAVREGLLNVEKHAAARTVVVSLGAESGTVQVAVADDGTPPDRDGPAGPTGVGMRMLAEKAARTGGRAVLLRDEDGGSTLRVTVPLPPRPEGEPS